MHYHIDPKRENDPGALEDGEVFYLDAEEAALWRHSNVLGVYHADNGVECEDDEPFEAGWYWWVCFPGYLPESDAPYGPFGSQEAAIEDSREWCGVYD